MNEIRPNKEESKTATETNRWWETCLNNLLMGVLWGVGFYVLVLLLAILGIILL